MSPKTAKSEEAVCEEEHARSFECPVRELWDLFERTGEEYFGAFKQTRIEFLKAVRTLIDQRIESIEGEQGKKKKKGRVHKIKIDG